MGNMPFLVCIKGFESIGLLVFCSCEYSGGSTSRYGSCRRRFADLVKFLEWLLPLLVQVLVAGPLHHPPLLTSQNMTSAAKSWVDQ